MKRLTIVLLSVVVTVMLASPIFGQGAFVEGNVPDGKVLIYIYRESGMDVGNVGPLVLTKSGLLGILVFGSYYSFIAEPGAFKLWLVGPYATDLKFEVVAGQVYYVRAGFRGISGISVPELKLMPRNIAMKEMAGSHERTE